MSTVSARRAAHPNPNVNPWPIFDSDLTQLVFFDTTSIYFEGDGGETLGSLGHSKDHRNNRKQMVVGVILDQ